MERVGAGAMQPAPSWHARQQPRPADTVRMLLQGCRGGAGACTAARSSRPLGWQDACCGAMAHCILRATPPRNAPSVPRACPQIVDMFVSLVNGTGLGTGLALRSDSSLLLRHRSPGASGAPAARHAGTGRPYAPQQPLQLRRLHVPLGALCQLRLAVQLGVPCRLAAALARRTVGPRTVQACGRR